MRKIGRGRRREVDRLHTTIVFRSPKASIIAELLVPARPLSPRESKRFQPVQQYLLQFQCRNPLGRLYAPLRHGRAIFGRGTALRGRNPVTATERDLPSPHRRVPTREPRISRSFLDKPARGSNSAAHISARSLSNSALYRLGILRRHASASAAAIILSSSRELRADYFASEIELDIAAACEHTSGRDYRSAAHNRGPQLHRDLVRLASSKSRFRASVCTGVTLSPAPAGRCASRPSTPPRRRMSNG